MAKNTISKTKKINDKVEENICNIYIKANISNIQCFKVKETKNPTENG